MTRTVMCTILQWFGHLNLTGKIKKCVQNFHWVNGHQEDQERF